MVSFCSSSFRVSLTNFNVIHIVPKLIWISLSHHLPTGPRKLNHGNAYPLNIDHQILDLTRKSCFGLLQAAVLAKGCVELFFKSGQFLLEFLPLFFQFLCTLNSLTIKFGAKSRKLTVDFREVALSLSFAFCFLFDCLSELIIVQLSVLELSVEWMSLLFFERKIRKKNKIMLLFSLQLTSKEVKYNCCIVFYSLPCIARS